MKRSTKIGLTIYTVIMVTLILLLFLAPHDIQRAIYETMDFIFTTAMFAFPILCAFVPWLFEALKNGADLK